MPGPIACRSRRTRALFSLIGTYFGGDGVNTFDLPDLRGRVAISQGQGTRAVELQSGAEGGAESVSLAASQAPTHRHTMMAASNVTAPNPGPGLALGSPATAVSCTARVRRQRWRPARSALSGPEPLTKTDEPYLGLNYIIALAGIFPSRS